MKRLRSPLVPARRWENSFTAFAVSVVEPLERSIATNERRTLMSGSAIRVWSSSDSTARSEAPRRRARRRKASIAGPPMRGRRLRRATWAGRVESHGTFAGSHGHSSTSPPGIDPRRTSPPKTRLWVIRAVERSVVLCAANVAVSARTRVRSGRTILARCMPFEVEFSSWAMPRPAAFRPRRGPVAIVCTQRPGVAAAVA